MSDQSYHWALPYIMPAQAQKSVTINQALRRIDGLMHLSVESRSRPDQPSMLTEGAAWILPQGPTGEIWSSWLAGDVAMVQDGAWARFMPQVGMSAYIAEETQLVMYTDAGWVALDSLMKALRELTHLGVGTSADDTNPFAAKLNNVLWTAKSAGEGGSGHLYKTLNKEAPANILSLLFKTNWSTRAEMGLLGDDTFTLRASADGASFTTVLRSVEGGVKTAFGPDWPRYSYHLQGEVGFTPPTNAAPQANGDVVMVLESDTALVFKVKGQDGIIRSARLTLA